MVNDPKVSPVQPQQALEGWQETVWPALVTSDYEKVASFYEAQVEKYPDVVENYWYLGLAYLLLRNEEKAQLSWFVALGALEEESLSSAQSTLIEILDQEATRQELLENNEIAWLIRGHLREIDASNINNLLRLFCLDIKLGELTPDKFSTWNIITVLNQETNDFSEELLLGTLEIALDFPMFESVAFAKASLKLTKASDKCEQIILGAAYRFCYDKGYAQYAIDLLQCCLDYHPEKLPLLKELFWFYSHNHDHENAFKISQAFLSHSQTLVEKLFGKFYQLRALLGLSDWEKILPVKDEYITLLKQFSQQTAIDQMVLPESSLTLFGQLLLYLEDNPYQNRDLTNQVARLFQQSVSSDPNNNVAPYKNILVAERPLRIGYVSFTFRNHSVSWLCRWLIQYHDKAKFPTYLYSMNFSPDDYLRTWLKKQATEFRDIGRYVYQVTSQIQKDEIDILVDLDSLTFNLTCQVMALKPAPVQVTWLGNDASGIPAIDYFIADPYVLPDEADSYYSEKIWRLPHTYLGIDGFEFGVPTLRREDLAIPADAIIYMNFQGSSKRYPATIRLQYKILKSVPNSYFLIKGTGDAEITQNFYKKLALEEDFPIERIRFIDRNKTEFEHRANLKTLADVVLDTYPYNGATTTLETLWSEIPLVTRVGQQFAARNSYTFMINAGITEGIAWTDEEYIEWGIKLGTDENLRKEISWKLRQSKNNSPLWNGQQFAREMEKAYRQMWKIYIQEHS